MKPDNEMIAEILERIADLLELKDANPFRVQAYRNAARSARAAEAPLAGMVRRGGRRSLKDLPDIGSGLAGVIDEIVKTGHASQLRRLEAEFHPRAVLARVPGIGEVLASRVKEELGITSLEQLELAAHDGRLSRVKGFGEQRVSAVKDSIAGMLSPAARRQARRAIGEAGKDDREPPIEILLDVDREYRQKAARGELKRIAPRRFNPEDEAWLPILTTQRGPWEFTALFSNTKRAHELGKTDDWVVIYFEREDQPEDQNTVVTETSGALEGKRVVRGREQETREYYQR